MISWAPYKCKACGQERFQHVVLLGMEFQYECPCCGALCVFYESLHYQFQDDFRARNFSRYVGTMRNGEFIDGTKTIESIMSKFLMLSKAPVGDPPEITVEVLSDKKRDGKFFVASSVYDHFQDAFRGVTRMRDHVLNRRKDTYNVMVIPREYELFYEPRAKLVGIDELWLLDLEKNYRWPFVSTEDDASRCNAANNALTKLLDSLEGIGETISKRSGPLRQGNQIIRKMLDPGEVNLGFDGKYMALMLKQRETGRATFSDPDCILRTMDAITAYGFTPKVVAVTEGEKRIAQCIDRNHVFAPKSLRQQVAFYKDHCIGVVGTNCSGCGLAVLYNLPIFSFAKKFSWPWDFYCMGRLLSRYDAEHPLGGDVEKPDNVVEIKLKEAEPVCLHGHLEAFADWVRRHVRGQRH